jgi:hypothetical protein
MSSMPMQRPFSRPHCPVHQIKSVRTV